MDGCRLTRCAKVVTPHADVAAVRSALAANGGRPAVVVTESVFSVDGDLAPLRALHEVCRAHGALLLVDRNTGHLISETTWRTPEALAASRSVAAVVRVETVTASDCVIRAVEEYGLVFDSSRKT